MTVGRLLVTGVLTALLLHHNVGANNMGWSGAGSSSCESDCRPKTTYVGWSTLREYLNQYHNTNIPLSVTGPALPVYRCRAELSSCCSADNLCGTGKYFCGIVNDTFTSRELCLTDESEGANYLLSIKYVEAKRCECKEEQQCEILRGKRIGKTPLVLSVNYTRNSP